jgi:drug/metabolite transporter (DMT)-like permease
MQLRLADRWWMGALVAVTGLVLLVLNVRNLGSDGDWAIAVASTASAAFLAALGFALTVQRSRTNV